VTSSFLKKWLYLAPIAKKKIIWVARVALLSEKRFEFKVFVRKPEGKMSEGLRSRVKGKVYMDL
jgi:hypothetical protein